jgi:hypothetical protein
VGTFALLLLLLAEAASGAPQPGRSLFTTGSIWAGNYTCGSTPAWLLLHFERVQPRLEAIFHFVYPSSGTHGAFTVVESADSMSRAKKAADDDLIAMVYAPMRKGISSAAESAEAQLSFTLDAEGWIREAESAEMVGIAGRVLAGETDRMVGTILHEHCDEFELVRTRVDLNERPRGARALMLHTYEVVQGQLARAGLGPSARRGALVDGGDSVMDVD